MAHDPEPPPGTVVLDACGTYWERYEESEVYGRIRWYPRDHDGDPETWIKVAGNYGPVTIVADARD